MDQDVVKSNRGVIKHISAVAAGKVTSPRCQLLSSTLSPASEEHPNHVKLTGKVISLKIRRLLRYVSSDEL
jgi:hypothetical protein